MTSSRDVTVTRSSLPTASGDRFANLSVEFGDERVGRHVSTGAQQTVALLDQPTTTRHRDYVTAFKIIPRKHMYTDTHLVTCSSSALTSYDASPPNSDFPVASVSSPFCCVWSSRNLQHTT